MTKYIINIIYCAIIMIATVNIGYSQPGDTPRNDVPVDDGNKPDCYDIKMVVPLHINKDCPTGDLNVKVNAKSVCPEDCNNPTFRIVVKVGFVTIFQGNTSKLVSHKIDLSTMNWNLANLFPSQGPTSINISVIMDCNDGRELSLYNENVTSYLHRNNEIFPFLTYIQTHSVVECPPPGSGEESVCCNQQHVLKTSISSVTSVNATDNFSSETNVSVTVGFNSDYNNVEVNFPIPLGGKNMFTNTIYSLYSETNSTIEITIDAPQTGCSYAGVTMNYDEFSLKWARANCFGEEEIDLTIPEEKIFYNAKYYPSICNKPSASNCLKPTTRIKKSTNLRFLSNCTGSLLVESYGGTGTNVNSVYWTGPNGNVVYGNYIEGVYGQYTLTIENECCEKFEETYFLCDETVNSPWVKETNGKWCRTVDCKGGPTLRTLCGGIFTECVTPDDVIETYIPSTKKCRKEYFYKGEKLGEDFVNAEVNTSYNQATKQCIRVYNCGGTPGGGETLTQSAQFGFWTYNSFKNLCERSVICFNETMPMDVLDTEAPEIVYKNLTSLCVAECDNFPSSQFFPINPGFWQWNTFQGCTKEVTCVATDGPFTVNGTASYNNWRVNNFNNMCESDVSCDNSNVFGAVNSIFPQSTQQWTWENSSGSLNCRRIVICSGNQVIQKSPFSHFTECSGGQTERYMICQNGVQVLYGNCIKTTEDIESRSYSNEISFFPNPAYDLLNFSGLKIENKYGIVITDILGKKVKETEINNNQVEVSTLTNGIYYLNIYKGKELLYKSKFIKI